MAHQTGDELGDIFEEIIDDTVSDELKYSLLENADQELRDERDWYILREKGNITRPASNDYEDGVSLASNFDRIRNLDDAVRSTSKIYTPIDPDKAEEYKDTDGYYYIKYDLDNEVWKIYFTGTITADETVYYFYQKRGTEVTADNATSAKTWLPAKRGTYIAWLAASRISGGVDGDEINFRMSPEQKQTARELKESLISWDSKLKTRALGGRTGIRRGRQHTRDGHIDTNYPYRS